MGRSSSPKTGRFWGRLGGGVFQKEGVGESSINKSCVMKGPLGEKRKVKKKNYHLGFSKNFRINIFYSIWL